LEPLLDLALTLFCFLHTRFIIGSWLTPISFANNSLRIFYYFQARLPVENGIGWIRTYGRDLGLSAALARVS